MKKKVLILSTGGTLGMRGNDGGPLKPNKVLSDLMIWVPELAEYADISLEILADLDSSLITPDLWLTLARRIELAHDHNECSGVVVLHGTDTLAYTASALSFLLPALDMPVVLTGGQRPLAEIRTDARNNVIGAVETAIEGPVEVMVFFNNTSYRGNRVTKTAIADFDGFNSPNFDPLGKAGIFWEWGHTRFWPKTRRPTIWPGIPDKLPSTPWVLPWVPGLDFGKLVPSLEQHWALILEAFGTGNMPFPDSLRNFLGSYIQDGGLVFIKSQVLRGVVNLEAYEPGIIMKDLGIVGGSDMTREAMVTKLMVLKGSNLSPERLKQSMARSLAGELTE